MVLNSVLTYKTIVYKFSQELGYQTIQMQKEFFKPD